MHGTLAPSKRVKRVDQESYVAYILYCVAFCVDGSVLTLAYPLSLLLYALLSTAPAAGYWQVSTPFGYTLTANHGSTH